MAERPIPFSAPMVRAILSGTKTQTRRAMRDQPCELLDFNRGHLSIRVRRAVYQAFDPKFPPVRCPYGQPGDRLWVREAWCTTACFDKTAPRHLPKDAPIAYLAGAPHHRFPRYRPPMFMPRWASRITLEVTGVRIERLQDISEADAKAEGISQEQADGVLQMAEAMDQREPRPFASAFQTLWNDINGPGSWDANPWVWAITFRRLS